MARPRKPEAERRTRTIGVRVNTAEASEIAEPAGAARMTKGGYMRRRARRAATCAAGRWGSPSARRSFSGSAPGSASNSTGSG